MASNFGDSENLTIILILYICSAFGILGSLFTITTYLLFKDCRNVATSLIFSLALSDFSISFGYSFWWMWFAKTHVVCNLQGAILMFGATGSLMWGLMIGTYMFLALYRKIEIEKIDKYSYLFHIFAWGYALMAAILPIFEKQYGVMYPGSIGYLDWCWVADPKSKYRLILYAPDFVVFGILNLLYGMLQYRMRNTRSSVAQRMCKKMNFPLSLFSPFIWFLGTFFFFFGLPFIYLLTYTMINVFAIINRVQNYVTNGDSIFELYVLQFLTQPLQGFLNAFAYAMNEPAFKEHYKNLFLKCRSKGLTKQQQAEKERLMSHVCYDDYDEASKPVLTA